MSNSSNTQKSNLFLKKAAYSLILGIIAVVLPYIIMVYQAGVDSITLINLLWFGTGLGGGSAKLFVLGVAIALICAIVGLYLGVQGLKSTGRRFAIAGIVVCAISMLSCTGLVLVWLVGGGPIYL